MSPSQDISNLLKAEIRQQACCPLSRCINLDFFLLVIIFSKFIQKPYYRRVFCQTLRSYGAWMDSSLVKLGKRLRTLRAMHKLTQEEFAQIAGIGYKFYQQIETANKKEIWLSTIERLAAAYNLEAWQLLAPNLPEDSKLKKKAPSSRVHRK